MSSPLHDSIFSWVEPTIDSHFADKLSSELNLHPTLSAILSARKLKNLEEVHQFLYGTLPSLYDPELFPKMEQAVERILLAIQKKETILVYGDNDVDGMSATALLTEFLRQVGGKVLFHLPNRGTEKMPFMQDPLLILQKIRASLLITVDCGIGAAAEIGNIVRAGIDVIITDHHEPTTEIPPCTAALNPKLSQSPYPYRELTGVGVAFKLAHAIANALFDEGHPPFDLKPLLDLVALGTIADMAPLTGENRILVRYGLKQMETGMRTGLSHLIKTSATPIVRLTPAEIGSKITPRLNSLGRVANPTEGVELLLTRDPKRAQTLVEQVDLHNAKRQKIERKAYREIETMAEESPALFEKEAIVLQSDNWHPGIVAILAAKVAKHYNRPTAIFSIEGNTAKGSLRTIPEFPLLSMLKAHQALLINFGGHNFAAGVTLLTEKIPSFKKAFFEAARLDLQRQDLSPKIFLDAPIEFEALTFDCLESLQLLEPFGPENPPPILYADVTQLWPAKIVGQNHLKLFLQQNHRMFEAIGFNMAHKEKLLQEKELPLRIAFTPQVHSFLEKTTIQLIVKDVSIRKKPLSILSRLKI